MTTTNSDNPPVDLAAAQKTLRQRLDAFGQRVRSRIVLEAAARCVVIVAGLFLLTFILDRLLRLSSMTRRGLLLALLVAIGIEIWRRVIQPLRMNLPPDVLAAALERKAHLPIAARVATVLELPTSRSSDVSSGVMIERAVAMSDRSLNAIDFESHLDDHRKKMATIAIAATLSVLLLLTVIFPSTVRLWAARLFAGSNQPWPQRTYLEVAGVRDGVLSIARGEPFALRVSARTGSVVPESISVRWRQGNSPRVNALLTRFGANDFRYDFPGVQSDVTAELSGGDDVVGPLAIRLVDRPRFVDLKLLTQHPTDPKSRVHSFSGEDTGDLSFLPHTRMELQFAANTAIAEARITSSTTQPSSGSLRKINDRQFALDWQHSAATQVQIELVGTEAGLTSVPTSVSIGLKADKPPRAVLNFSGVRQRITPQATIPLMAEARDDFGVNRIDLQIKTEIADSADAKKTNTGATTRPIFGPATQPSDVEPEIRQTHSVSVAEMKLEPGHVLSAIGVASDNCYTGAQSTSSRQLVFRVVKPDELFKEIRMRQQTERAKFRKQIEEARKVQEVLTVAATPQSVGQLSRQHRTMQREVVRIQTAFAESLTEMKLNVLGSPETYEVMDRAVIGPMKNLDVELMTPQRDALDVLRSDDAAGMEAAKMRQGDMIDRMGEILNGMSQWDSFIDMLNQLNELIRIETQVQQGTNQLKKSQIERAFD